MKNKDIKELENIYYKILLENQYILQEMFVIGEDLPNYNFIAYKDKIWKINTDSSQIPNDVRTNIQVSLKYRILNSENFERTIYHIINSNPGNNEMLFGSVNNRNMIIYDQYFPMIKDKRGSVLFKKVVSELKPSNIQFQSDHLKNIDKGGFYSRRDTDKVFYHGTSSDKLMGIMRKGLDKNSINMNYPESVRSVIGGQTFITSNFRYAMSHAVLNAKVSNSYPVVISFVVRFEDLLQPDYDVKRTSTTDQRALKVSREMGIYGYKGNILPTDFEEIFISPKKSLHVDNYSSNDILNIDAQTTYQLMTVKGYTPDELIEFRRNYK